MEYIRDYKWAFADQDLLNFVVTKKSMLSPSWNFMTFNYFLRYSEDRKAISLIPPTLERPNKELVNSVPDAITFYEILEDPAIMHFAQYKPWGGNNGAYKTLPSSLGLAKVYKEWFATARSIPEFADELAHLRFLEFTIVDINSHVLAGRMSELELRVSKENKFLSKRRKRDNKKISIGFGVLLIMQIVTLVLLFMK